MDKTKTKKQKILDLFGSHDWFSSITGEPCKIFQSDDFYKIGLAGQWEYGEKYNDIIYAKRIFQKMGYTVLIGSAFYVIDKSKNIKTQ